jgi:predicted acetyltransferase
MMAPAVEVAAVAEADRDAFGALLDDYLTEMGAILSQPPLRPYPGIDRYWAEPEHWPLWILDRGRRVGFALVRRLNGVFDVAEFFVARESRRTGVGTNAARAIIAVHPGRWRITQREANTNAIAFWHRVLEIHPYEERSTNEGAWRREQVFTVAPG